MESPTEAVLAVSSVAAHPEFHSLRQTCK
uniref:Pco087106a n=1 Tax=Arundo donax TaxID=35708 RepID=A0A0A9F225_ARUDO